MNQDTKNLGYILAGIVVFVFVILGIAFCLSGFGNMAQNDAQEVQIQALQASTTILTNYDIQEYVWREQATQAINKLTTK
jgi:sensor histidine kinase regulating citrate/malate metabolism